MVGIPEKDYSLDLHICYEQSHYFSSLFMHSVPWYIQRKHRSYTHREQSINYLNSISLHKTKTLNMLPSTNNTFNSGWVAHKPFTFKNIVRDIGHTIISWPNPKHGYWFVLPIWYDCLCCPCARVCYWKMCSSSEQKYHPFSHTCTVGIHIYHNC